MKGKYVGSVSNDDPLHGFLSKIIRDESGGSEPRPAFRVFRLSGSNEVYGYEEKSSRTRVICKFYGPRFGWDRDQAATLAHQEYERLKTLRGYQLIGSPHHVIRPLGCQPRHQRRAGGRVLRRGAVQPRDRHVRPEHGDDAHLYLAPEGAGLLPGHPAQPDRQRRPGRFRARLPLLRHGRRSAAPKPAASGTGTSKSCAGCAICWRGRPRMWQDQQVWLHGDATPANFLFGHGLDVAAIDLERMKRGDRMFDVGRVAGELQHAFMARNR